MGFNSNKHCEEAKTYPLVENLDDASEYIPIWGMTKALRGSLLSPTQFEDTVMNPLMSVSIRKLRLYIYVV